MKYYTDLVVRSYECDSYGHVNNAVYLNYLEYGRMEYLHQINFDYNGIVKAGYYLYVTHIDIYYKESAFLDDKIKIEVSAKSLGAVSGTIHEVLTKQDGSVCAEADVTWASVSSETGRPTRLPKEFMVEGLKPDSE
jgi:YbgC/YbaW family acyl-CoA thioester hydrolase